MIMSDFNRMRMCNFFIGWTSKVTWSSHPDKKRIFSRFLSELFLLHCPLPCLAQCQAPFHKDLSERIKETMRKWITEWLQKLDSAQFFILVVNLLKRPVGIIKFKKVIYKVTLLHLWWGQVITGRSVNANKPKELLSLTGSIFILKKKKKKGPGEASQPAFWTGAKELLQ